MRQPTPKFELELPHWISPILEQEHIYTTVEERMSFVLNLGHLNIQHGSGGPFAAALFNQDNGQLITPGVNLVTSTQCSVAHAEIVAIILGQQKLQSYDLSTLNVQLVTSTEPCAMCLGAIPWSGVRSVVCGAADSDARAIGFDEGAKPTNWHLTLEQRGIEVIQNIKRKKAVELLQSYASGGGTIYNGCSTAETG